MNLSTHRLFVAILFVALFAMTAREIADPDFWWHLRAGQSIIETHSVPRVDVFSGTVAGQPWVAHEWLSEVFIYALFTLGSFLALILACSAIVTLAFVFVYARSDGQPYVAAFAVLLAALASAPTWGVRPQVISLLLTSVFLFVLERWRADLGDHKGRPYIWILVPLMVLWVNLHSGFALGLAIIAVYLFGAIVDRVTQPPNHPTTQPPNHPTTQLALIFITCLLVVPLNPNGATLYIYPFETLTSHAMQTYIQEWFSPDFHLTEFQPFAWLLLATLAAVGMSGKRVSLTQTLLLVVFGYAALRSSRNIPLFAIIAAPIMAEHVWRLVAARGWTAALEGNAPTTRRMAALNWALLLVIFAAGVARVGMVAANQSAVERAKFPAAAVDFLQAQKVTGTIYNSYGWGGYVIWRLYPGARVFIDGRADVYGDAFIEQYLAAYRGEASWKPTLERYNIRTILIEPDAPLTAQLAQDAAWKQVYEDKQAVVFEKQ